MWEYRAACVRVIDGDTYEMKIDLGFKTSHTVAVRLKDYDTCELNARDPQVRAQALRAKQECIRLLQAEAAGEWPVTVRTAYDKTFDRYVAEVEVGGVSIGEHLVALGLAVKV